MTGTIVWFTGLPGSGKSTLAERVHARLAAHERTAVVLDGDTLRSILGAGGYATADRDAFYRTLVDLAISIALQGAIVLVAATAPSRAHRDRARVPGLRFAEVWVRTPLAECEARDDKGLYARARRGELANLPGVGVAFEPPVFPDVVAEGGHDAAAVTAIEHLIT